MQKESPSSLARYLFAAYALLVTYASLHPFSGWAGTGVPALGFLTLSLPRYFTAFDVIVNFCKLFVRCSAVRRRKLFSRKNPSTPPEEHI